MITVADLAKMIDHSLLHPTMTDAHLRAGCELAKQYQVAAVCIKPYAVKMAVELLRHSDVAVGTVVGFPHGNSTLMVKAFETEQACQDGAIELDLVPNIGKVLSSDWPYVLAEIQTILKICRQRGAILKVIFENDYLPNDQFKIKLCQICSDLKVDFVKTSTGYGFVKGEAHQYFYRGATDHDLKLMREYTIPAVQVKAAGGIRTLDDLLRVRALGVTRVGATTTAAILTEAKKRYGE